MSAFASAAIQTLAPNVGYAYIRLLKATMRLEYRNQEILQRAREQDGQYILTFWHSRFVLMPYCYPDRKLVVLHSQHRDAQLLVSIMKRFGLAQAWGSTTRGGAGGVRSILRKVREGYDVGMTPDGPRGPRRRIQPGVIAIARFTGKPIIPVAFSARPMRRLGSWDRTLLPYPFGAGLFVYGEPLRVPRDADDATQERLRLELESRLDEMTDAADREFGIPPEDARPAVDVV